ncbi:MAG: toll/interleukin-1 receptor domain-containing protein [Gimesia sp.]
MDCEDRTRERDFLLCSENPKFLLEDLFDGTNMTSETKSQFKEIPQKDDIKLLEHNEVSGWTKRFEVLLSEMRDLRKEALPVGVILTQQRTPGYLSNGVPDELNISHKQIASSFCILRDPISLAIRSDLEPLFAFLDPSGQNMQYSNRVPIPYKLGFSRHYTFIKQPLSSGDHRDLKVIQMNELFKEAGNLIRSLPKEVLKKIWNRRGPILRLPKDGTYSWVDALFEFSWTSLNNRIPLSRHVYDESGYTSLTLHGEGLFPRIPFMSEDMSSLLERFPHEAGIPFSWSSKTEDCLESSIELINWILSDDWKINKATDQALKVFISYCHEDESHLNHLKKCLTPLSRKNRLDLWHDRDILAASNLDSSISEKLDDSDIFIFLLSPDFLQSEYCTGIELKRAIKRAHEGNASLLGIVIRPCAWHLEFPNELLVLPTDAKPVTNWTNKDDAWLNITIEIDKLCTNLAKAEKPWTHMIPNNE